MIAEAIWSHGILSGFAAFTSSTVLHGFARYGKNVHKE